MESKFRAARFFKQRLSGLFLEERWRKQEMNDETVQFIPEWAELLRLAAVNTLLAVVYTRSEAGFVAKFMTRFLSVERIASGV